MGGGRQDWRTPAWLFRALDRIYGPFVLDAAATAETSLCPCYCGDGLEEPWENPTYANPPYGKERGGVGAWVAKAEAEAARGVRSVMLVDGIVASTAWFRTRVWAPFVTEGRPRVVPLPRLLFEGAPTTAPFVSLLIIWEAAP
jgi:phage N-6-adenine-methyltransferase